MVGRIVQNRQTLLERGRIGAGSTLFVRSEAGRDILQRADLHNSKEVVVIPACPDEPAVVTLQRIERQKANHIFLATEIDGVGVAILLSPIPKTTNFPSNNVELKGGITTKDWMILMRSASIDTTYSAEGTEFKPVLDALGTFETAY